MFSDSSQRNLFQYFLFQAYPEDEHELIAAYAQQLANAPDAKNMEAMSSHSRNLVRELERKNREIMRDIHHLKRAHRNQRIMQMPPGEDPSIVTELEVHTYLKQSGAQIMDIMLDRNLSVRKQILLNVETSSYNLSCRKNFILL